MGLILDNLDSSAPGAIPNQTRITKCAYEHSDKHSIGCEGVVIGSIELEIEENQKSAFVDKYAYLVHFDGDNPGILTFVTDKKIRALQP